MQKNKVPRACFQTNFLTVFKKIFSDFLRNFAGVSGHTSKNFLKKEQKFTKKCWESSLKTGSRLFFTILTLFFLSSTSFAQENTTQIEDDKIDAARLYTIATIQVLNKTTAKTSILKIKLGEKTKFERLGIIAHKCWQASLDQKPESKILLEVFEDKSDKESKRIFYGWMFASSPSISGIEHPVYDIVALNCKNK